jgi:hypothetical protein
MAERKPSYTQLTHDVVHRSSVPLTLDEIMEQVNALRPITTKNPRSTIRGAIGASRLIVSTGDGRYGWMQRVINGSIIRQTLRESDILMEVLQWSEELREALWPTFFAKQKYMDRGPVIALLPNGKTTEFTLEHLYEATWGTHVTPDFWEWFNTLNTKAGDHLLFKVEDGEAKRYSVTYQSRAERDEEAIAARNEMFLEMVEKKLNRPSGAAPWDISAHALATGLYQHPIPPDPLYELLPDTMWGFANDPGVISPEVKPDPLLSELFERLAHVYDPENPPDLPREYDPNYGRRRPRPSRKAQEGELTSYTFRVNHRALPKVWRDIEIAEDQTLEDLHLAIQQAYGWYDDHLYSFYMSSKAWDSSSEIGSPWSDSRVHTHQVQSGLLELKEGKKFLYLFDYGDNHEFDVTVLSINPKAKKGKYPKVVGRKGKSPPQYPDYDEDTGEMSWDPYSHWG